MKANKVNFVVPTFGAKNDESKTLRHMGLSGNGVRYDLDFVKGDTPVVNVRSAVKDASQKSKHGGFVVFRKGAVEEFSPSGYPIVKAAFLKKEKGFRITEIEGQKISFRRNPIKTILAALMR